MPELVELIRKAVAEAGDMGSIGLIGVLAIVAKYSVDIWRSAPVQNLMGRAERMFRTPRGWLTWDGASDNTKSIVGIVQAFLVALLGAMAAGMDLKTAALGALLAAFGTKGIHDAGFLPGKKPGAVVPSPSRPLSLKTNPPPIRK